MRGLKCVQRVTDQGMNKTLYLATQTLRLAHGGQQEALVHAAFDVSEAGPEMMLKDGAAFSAFGIGIGHNPIRAKNRDTQAFGRLARAGFAASHGPSQTNANPLATKLVYHLKKIIRRRRTKGQLLLILRMFKAQLPGMKHLTRRAGRRGLVRIDRVAQQRMSQGGHMHAYLVGAAGQDPHTDERSAVVGRGPKHAIPRFGCAAPAFDDGHASLDAGVPPHGQIDFATRSGHSGHQGQIFLVDETGGKSIGQGQAGRFGQGQDNEPRRVFVQAMYDARTLSGLVQQNRKMMGHAVHQRRFADRRGRMHGQSRILVHYHQMLVGKDDVQRPVVRDKGRILVFGGERHRLTGHEPCRRLDAHLPIDACATITNPGLDSASGHALFIQAPLPKGVQP